MSALPESGSTGWNSSPWLIFWSALWGLAEAYGSLWPSSKYYDCLSELEVTHLKIYRVGNDIHPDLPRESFYGLHLRSDVPPRTLRPGKGMGVKH